VKWRKPRALQPGDTIAVVSPASPIPEDKLRSGLKLLEDAGYRVVLGKAALRATDYLAGTDEERASDLQWAFDDPDVAAVWCSRGGYGCARLLPYLDLDRMAASGKMFLGFSDVTTLHLALNRRGLVTFYAPMALTFSVERPAWVRESFLGALEGRVAVPAGAPRANSLRPGTVEGRTTGGCLCLVCDSIGTPDALDAQDKLLLLEDIDENPHRVDAMLTHLLHCGLIQRAAGLVIGEMTNTDSRCDATIGARAWREIFRERLQDVPVPAMVGYPFGHMSAMLTVPLGIRARMDASQGTLHFLESPCE